MGRTITHCGAFRRDRWGQLSAVLYYPSKWPRVIGDHITIEGRRYTIEIIEGTRNATVLSMNKQIEQHNRAVKRHESIIRKEERTRFAEDLLNGLFH